VAAEIVLSVEAVGKKYCKTLKRSMVYGLQDMMRDTVGVRRANTLRPHEFWALDNVSFDLRAGGCLGLIGRNGAGKSTLLKVLNGIFRPDAGLVRISGRVGALIEAGAGFHPQLTGLENIYVNASILGMRRAEVDRKLDAIIDFADIGDFINSPVKFYSSGMFVRLGMAIAVHTDPEILLIDEVFAVGDVKFQAKCFNKLGELRRRGVSFILVSHNLHHISGFANSVVVLEHGRLVEWGESTHAINTFMELMRAETVSDPAGDALPNGSGRVRFLNVAVIGRDGLPVRHLAAGEPVTLEIEFDAMTSFPDVELDLVAYAGGSSPLLQTSNRLMGQRMDLPAGRGRLSVRIPYLPVNGRRVMFTAALWGPSRHELLDWRREIFLEVEGCSSSTGQYWVKCDFGVEKASTGSASAFTMSADARA
jgi:lipopolysaccharide transport system ATP-binding protein